MAEIKIEDGKIKIPYNFNNEKYIVGIEDKKTNEIKVSKTIIPIKDAKPSYSLDITPKNKGSFNLKKNKNGEYEYVNTQIVYNINFIVNDIDVPSADIEISTDWNAKYILNKNVNPFEFILELNEKNDANKNITTSSPQYDLLENNGNFVDEINIDIEYHDIIYRTKIKVTFQKSYFETISLYDSIDIPSRTTTTEVKKGVITIDGYYNDDKVNKEDLVLTLDTSNSGFTSIASTMGYMDIVKEKNDWFLTHNEKSSNDYAKTPLYNYYVDNNYNIYEDGKMVVSGNTLYDKKNERKVLDSSGNTYFNNDVKMIDNSGNTIIGAYISIDHSGNTKYRPINSIGYTGNILINNSGNTIHTSGGTKIIDLDDYKLTGLNGNLVVVSADTVYSGTSINNTILTKDKDKDIWKVPLSGNSYYNFKTQIWNITNEDEPLYSNKDKKLYFSGNTKNYIDITNNTYYVGNNKVIDSGGTVSGISGFGYNIKTGVISDSSGTVLVTAITSNNTGTTKKATGYTFNSGCTSGYGYYIGDINGTLYHNNGKNLLSANTIYDVNGDVFAKYNNNKIYYQLSNGYWIYTYSSDIRYITGYTSSDLTTTAFTISSSIQINDSFVKTGSTTTSYYIEDKENGNKLIYFSNNGIKKDNVNKINFKYNLCTISGTTAEIAISSALTYIHGSYNIKYNNTDVCNCNLSLTPTALRLTNNCYYLPNNKTIQYGKTSSDTSMPQAIITATTIGISGKTGYTHISAGTINYYSSSSEYINLLNCKNGISYVNTGFTYDYSSNQIKYNTGFTIADFRNNYIYKSSGVKVLSLANNNIINNNNQVLVSSSLTVDLGNSHIYKLESGQITGKTVSGTTIFYDLNNPTGVTISGQVLGGMYMDSLSYNKNTRVTTCRDSGNEIFKITTGGTINLNLSSSTYPNASKYKLTATTSNDKVRIVTGITISANNHTYTWKENDKYIEVGDEKLTNNNNDRLFYYCNKDGEILYNKNKINYVIDEKGEYWDLTNGKKIIIKDIDDKKNTIYINLKNKKAVPPRNKIKDKYGNIKINKGKSYNSSNGTYRDKNNRIIVKDENDSSQYSIDEIYCTTAVSLNDGYIYDSNGRALMNTTGKSVYIEGGLELTKQNNGTDTIKKEGVVLVNDITNNSIGVLTNLAKEYGVTQKDGTYYYKNKKLYDSNGAYYFEEAITGTTNTGFTLQNGLIVSPLNGNITGYTSGVTIKSGSTTLVTISKNKNKENEYTYNIGTDSNNFSIKDGILLYKNIIIADVNNGIIYNMREPSDLSNIPDTSFIAESGTDIIIDETGNDDDYELEEKDKVYYDAHHISEIKNYIPDLSSYIFKCNNSGGHKLNVKTSYMGVMEDEKDYYIVDGGKNNSSYKIKVEPQFITQNMINNGSTIKAYIVNNNGDQIPHSTYTGNGYNFKYTTDASNSETGITADTFILTLSTATPIFNEIKFSLHCNNVLVNQEIVEVLGENKLIKLTEYVDVTSGSKTYVIQPTANTYYGTNIEWKNNRTHIITSLTMSSSSTIQVISGYCNDVLVYEQTVLPLKKGEQGISGATGNPGPRGKLLYPAGRWDSGTTYDGTDEEKTPFVMYNDKYWVLTATKKVSGNTPSSSSTAWTEMEQYEAIYTKLLVAENGLVGGSVYNGDYVFSKNGIIDGNNTNEYSLFNDSCVEAVFEPKVICEETETESGIKLTCLIEEAEGFIPNYLVDFDKGRAWFGGGNTRIDENGVVYTKEIVESIKDVLIPFPETGGTGWDLIKTGHTLTDKTNNKEEVLYYKNINYLNSLNSYIYNNYIEDGYNVCPTAPIILHCYMPDNIITRTDTFYKGEIYLGSSCASKRYITFPGQTIKYNNGTKIALTGNTINIINTYGINKIDFLVKWDGSYVKIKKINNNDDSSLKKLDIELFGTYDISGTAHSFITFN